MPGTKKAKKTTKATTQRCKKTYKILDNGGTPYVVEITPTTVCIEDNKGREIYETPYQQVFLGEGRLTDAIYRKGSSIRSLTKGANKVSILLSISNTLYLQDVF